MTESCVQRPLQQAGCILFFSDSYLNNCDSIKLASFDIIARCGTGEYYYR